MGRIKLGKKRDKTGLRPKMEVGSIEMSQEAMEGGRIVMRRLAKGLPARPGGEAGETIAIARCPGCCVRAILTDNSGMLSVKYEPYETSEHCKHGLEGKAKGLYCKNMKPAFERAQTEFFESVYRDSVEKNGADGRPEGNDT